MPEPRTEALPAETRLKDILPTLDGKAWFMARADDQAGIQAGLDALARGDAASDNFTGMTARDPRGIGVRGGYPQINVGIPGQQQTLTHFVRYAYKRSAPARIIVDKVAGDVWGEWVTFQCKDEALQRAVEVVCKNPTGRAGDRPLWWWLERGYRLARRDRRSLLYFSLEDNNAATPILPPTNVRGIRGLTIIRSDAIETPIIGEDPANPATYGRVTAWRVRLARDGRLGKAGASVDVHPDRCVPMIPYPTEEDEWDGESILAQNINYVEMLENLVWANAEAYFTEASPYIVVSLDKDVKLTAEEVTAAKASVAGMQQASTQRIFLRGVTVTVLAGSGTLANPIPHWEVAMKMFAMALGGMPTSILTGDQAGALTASSEDSRRYSGMNSKVQEQDGDPILRAVLSRLVAWDVKSWGQRQEEPIDFNWNPLYEEAPGNEATRQEALMRSRTGYRSARLPLPVDIDYEAVEWPEGTEDHPEPAPAFGFGKGDSESLKGAPDAVESAILRFRARIIKALRPAFTAAAASFHETPARGDASPDGARLIIDSPAVRDALAQAIEDAMTDSLIAGGTASASRIGPDAYYQHLQGTQPFRSLSRGLADDVAIRLSDDVRRIVAAELAAGGSPAGISAAIMARFDATRVDADRIARTESIRAFNRGGLEAMQQSGVASYRWSAFADADEGNPTGVCASLNGQVFPVGRGPVPVDDTHPNCKCALLPVVA